MSDNPLADKRPDWEKFPNRWAMCDGGFVYHPGGARYDSLPEEVKARYALPQSKPEEKEEEAEPEAATVRPLLDARGLIDVF